MLEVLGQESQDADDRPEHAETAHVKRGPNTVDDHVGGNLTGDVARVSVLASDCREVGRKAFGNSPNVQNSN